MNIKDEFITLEEAIEITGLTERYLRRYLNEHNVTKLGKSYLKHEFIDSFRKEKVPEKIKDKKTEMAIPSMKYYKPNQTAKEFVDNLLKNKKFD